MNQFGLEGLFDKLTAKLVEEKPENPIKFLISQLESIKKEKESERKVVFVLGGPGSGKGTQCARLVERNGFVHFSAGDLLREARFNDPEHGPLIDECIREGQIVPGHITIALLKKAIMETSIDKVVLVDGFPREMKQCLDFEDQIVPCQIVLFFNCPESVLEERLLKRGLTSGRTDDNIESIKKRFNTYQAQTLPVIEYFRAFNKVRAIDTSVTIDEVYDRLVSLLKEDNLI